MTNALSPIVSEFASEAQAQAYDVWFKARIAQSLADPRPRVAHDAVMSKLQALIASKAKLNHVAHAG